MSLILCRHEPVKHPYYIDVLGIHIHSSQELCYVIYNHPILVMDDFIDELLIEFIRRDLDMDYLAGRHRDTARCLNIRPINRSMTLSLQRYTIIWARPTP